MRKVRGVYKFMLPFSAIEILVGMVGFSEQKRVMVVHR